MKTASDKYKFYELFTQLISVISRPPSDTPDIPEIEHILIEICEVLRISKAVTPTPSLPHVLYWDLIWASHLHSNTILKSYLL